MNPQQRSKITDGIGSYYTSKGQLRYRVVMTAQGKVVGKGGHATKQDAVRWRDDQRANLHRGEYLDPAKGRLLFGAFAEDWLASAPLRPTTRANYRHIFDHQLASWANVPLANITPTAVRQWVGKLRTTPGTRTKRLPSRAYVLKPYTLLKKVCSIAVKEGYLRVNPCNVEMGSEVRPDLYCPTAEEVLALADAVPPNCRALVLLAGFGGLRWGEAIALTRRNVNVETGCVEVKQVVAETITHDVYLQPMPKTEAGRRTVYLPAVVVEAMILHLAKFAESGPDGLLFYATSTAGERPYLRRGNFRNRVWNPAVKAVGIPKTRFHDLRHAAATLAAQAGATTAELMAHIGHTTPRAAMRYQHAADDRMKAMGAMLDRFIPTPAAATGSDNVVPLRR